MEVFGLDIHNKREKVGSFIIGTNVGTADDSVNYINHYAEISRLG
jgi:hypothetical protein